MRRACYLNIFQMSELDRVKLFVAHRLVLYRVFLDFMSKATYFLPVFNSLKVYTMHITLYMELTFIMRSCIF